MWALLVVSAPWALVLVVALLRGYRVHIDLERPRPPQFPPQFTGDKPERIDRE